MSEPKRTPLYDAHLRAGARIVPFAGWEMPVSYRGILAEHKAVREAAGLFDVSHMGRFRMSGPGAAEVLDLLLTGRASAVQEGRWVYTLMLNEKGGVLEDLLVGRLDDEFLLVVNASNRDRDYLRLAGGAEKNGRAVLADDSEALAMLAIQGPASRDILAGLLDNDLSGLGYYRMNRHQWRGSRLLISRTGYTGELGYEVFVPAGEAAGLWEALLKPGRHEIVPCGLGARDTLRLEMGYPLYGNELDADHTPLEAGLGWTVDFDKKDFVGKGQLEGQKARGAPTRLMGLESARSQIPRAGYKLLQDSRRVGFLASGTLSPSLNIGIGTAYLPKDLAAPGTVLDMELRGKPVPATVVKTPFYKKGTARL